MKANTEGLLKYAKNKREETVKKVDKTIRELSLNGHVINFNSVSKHSGVSKNFLYNNLEIRKRIQELRNKAIDSNMNSKVKCDKTAKSKDIIIVSKNKKIRQLEEENKKLKLQLETLQAQIYNNV